MISTTGQWFPKKHWPLLFYNNIAVHCKILYANLSQQLHTITTNLKVLHGHNHRNHPWRNYRLVTENWKSPKVLFQWPWAQDFNKRKKKNF